MSLTETNICNMALGRIGANRILNIDDTSEDSTQNVLCQLHYDQTRDALLRSHWWRFARERVELVDSGVTPDFEWDYQFSLPDDFLAMRSIYEDRVSDENIDPYELEGKTLLTDESEMFIRYIKQVTDPDDFDPLFIEVLVLQLALKLVSPLGGGEPRLRKELKDDLYVLMQSVRALDRQETNTAGRDTWNDERYS